MESWTIRALGGLGVVVLSAGCISTGERPQTADSLGDSTTGEDSSLSLGSLVTGLEEASTTAPMDGSAATDTGPADDTDDSADATTGSADGSSGDGTSTGGTIDLPEYCGDTIPMAGDEPLIDDLEVEPGQMLPDDEIPPNDDRVGFWFTYNDGSATGMQTPLPGSFQPSAGGAAKTAYAAGTSGSGFTQWGAGMGVKLNNDFSGDCPYDASTYDGITFQAYGNVTVRLSITTRATHPLVDGGTCDPERGQCSDNFGASITLQPQWEVYEIAWADLMQQGWGQPADFDPGQIIEIQWQAPVATPFDMHVDELSFW